MATELETSAGSDSAERMGRRPFAFARWSALSLAALLALGTVFAWALRRAPAAPADPAPPPPAAAQASAVDAVRVARADLPLRSEATGYLQAWRRVEVKAEAGGRVVERRVENGSRVAADELVLRLDDRDRRIELEEARAEWLKIRAAFAVDYEAGGEAARAPPRAKAADPGKAEDLYAGGFISRRELEEARRRAETESVLSGAQQNEVRAAATGLTQAEQRIERAKLALERTRILAPFAGRIADLAVEYGQQVSPGERLLTLLEDDRIKVDVDVLEADMVHLRPGTPARVRIPSLDDLALTGAVLAVNPQVDSKTGTGRVTVAISNPRQLLLSGLFANVELEVRRLRDRLVVPAAALLERQGRHLVFRIVDGRAVWTYVRPGARSGDLVEVAEGLDAGDLVAVRGHFALAHEAPVKARIVRPAAAGEP